MNIEASISNPSELSWLSDVDDAGPQLTQKAPIWVRHFVIRSGPAMGHPERHPYCELGIHLSGSGVEYVEREKAVRRPGDLFLAGPGVPHWFRMERYPLTGTVIYFLPHILCEFGPSNDGLHLLRRFTARRCLEERLVRPPAPLRERFLASFADIHREFQQRGLGYEIRLRTVLLEMLVDLVRWEQRVGKTTSDAANMPKWNDVSRALQYLKEHFAEPVYAHDVAKAVGVSESRLKVLFREALGMPWSRYVQGYRIQQAVALLSANDCNVTQAALAVGFESLSHFNATFRSFVGVSPSEYLKRQQGAAKSRA